MENIDYIEGCLLELQNEVKDINSEEAYAEHSTIWDSILFNIKSSLKIIELYRDMI